MKSVSSDAKGEQLGVMPLHEALKQVEAQELDLVEVARRGPAAGLPHDGLRQVPLRAEKEIS